MTTEIEKFKQETARQVAAAITEKRHDCVFTLIDFTNDVSHNQKKRILDKAGIILKSAGIKMILLMINLVPVAPDDYSLK